MVRKIKKNKKRKWLFLLFALILLFFSFFIFFKIFISINKSLWDGKSQFNLVINSQPVMVVSFSHSGKAINILSIPDGTFVEAIHGYGSYRSESLYKLGEIKERGGELLRGSFQEYFGVNLEGYLTGGQYQPEKLKMKAFLLNNFLNALYGKEETNLTNWDLLRSWWQVKKIREDKIFVMDLGQSSVSQEVDLPDGSKAMKIETERLTKIINQLFIDGGLKKEDLTIAVLNKTKHFGLANNASKIINNIGGRVVQVSNLQNQNIVEEGCEVKSEKKDKNSYTVEKLKNIFNCHWLEKEGDEQRAKIILLLGEDYWRKLNLP